MTSLKHPLPVGTILIMPPYTFTIIEIRGGEYSLSRGPKTLAFTITASYLNYIHKRGELTLQEGEKT